MTAPGQDGMMNGSMGRTGRVLAATAVLMATGFSPAAVGEHAAWVPASAPSPLERAQLSVVGDGVAFVFRAGTDAGSAQLLRTDDGGVTFAPVLPADPTPTGFTDRRFRGVRALRFVDAVTGYALRVGSTLRVTRDGGASFRGTGTLPTVDGAQTIVGTLAAEGDVVALGGTAERGVCGDPVDTTTGLLLWSTDGAASWRTVQTPQRTQVHRIEIWDAHSAAAVLRRTDRSSTPIPGGCTTTSGPDTGSEVIVTTTGWVGEDVDEPGYVTVHDCAPASCTALSWIDVSTLAVGQSDGVVVILRDGVEVLRAQVATVDISGLDFPTPEIGYAATREGGLHRSRDGGASWLQELSYAPGVGLGSGEIAAFDATSALADVEGTVARRTELPADTTAARNG